MTTNNANATITNDTAAEKAVLKVLGHENGSAGRAVVDLMRETKKSYEESHKALLTAIEQHNTQGNQLKTLISDGLANKADKSALDALLTNYNKAVGAIDLAATAMGYTKAAIDQNSPEATTLAKQSTASVKEAEDGVATTGLSMEELEKRLTKVEDDVAEIKTWKNDLSGDDGEIKTMQKTLEIHHNYFVSQGMGATDGTGTTPESSAAPTPEPTQTVAPTKAAPVAQQAVHPQTRSLPKTAPRKTGAPTKSHFTSDWTALEWIAATIVGLLSMLFARWLLDDAAPALHGGQVWLWWVWFCSIVTLGFVCGGYFTQLLLKQREVTPVRAPK